MERSGEAVLLNDRGVVVVVAILLAVASSTPAPAPARPLKQIIEVHSQTPLCTTLEQAVAPALAGLIKDDQIIDSGQRVLRRMVRASSQAGDMDRLQLENASLALVHNLAIVDNLLADAKKFPANPRSDDERAVSQIKADLLSVVTRQKEKLNLLYGMMDTYELGKMQTGFPLFNPTVGPGADDAVPDMQATPVQTPPPIAAAGLSIGPVGSPRIAGSSSETSSEKTTAALEDRASVEIERAAEVCARSGP